MKKMALSLMVLICLFIFSGCNPLSLFTCQHEWQDATCTEPKTCTKCGKTEGEALGHTWRDATCTEPKTCTKCGKTEGEALGHTWRDATCTEPKTCTKCGETVGKVLEHQEGDWEILDRDMIDATITSEKRCVVCKAVVETKTEKIDRLHDGKVFLVTPNEFSQRMNNALDGMSGNDLTVRRGTVDGDFVIGFFSGDEKKGVLMYTHGDDSIGEDQKDAACFNKVLGTADGADYFARIMVALIQACDPSLSFSESKDIASEALSMGSRSKNGLKYVASISGNTGVFGVTIEE